MPCEHRDLGDGAFAIICTRGGRTNPCKYCGRPHTKLCDFPLTGPKAGKTCDIPMCEKCATHFDQDTDYCRAHTATMQANVSKIIEPLFEE
jgi:hypothetical protein